jgi:predicted amidohydrolase YtcJ
VPDTRGWVRGLGYAESVAGDLDAAALDRMRGGRPVRVQHRSGALWMLNSAALAAIGADGPGIGGHPGVERGADGRPNGRFWRADTWLRSRLPPSDPPDLERVGAILLGHGITAVTDATPGLDSLAGQIGAAHAARRPVAVHCVTREALVLLIAALREAGARPGDRIEHAALVPADLVPDLARLGVRVVTQPGFLADRGDGFLRDVDPRDRDDLYRCGSLLRPGSVWRCPATLPTGRWTRGP